jgi:hypothetical protein
VFLQRLILRGKNLVNDRRFFILLVLALLVGLSPRWVQAGAFDAIPSGARAVGMGGAYTAVADDANSVAWNPAGLGGVRRPQITFNHIDVQTLGLLSYDQFMYAQPFVYRNAIAASWFRLGTTGQVTSFNYAENTFILTYEQNLQSLLPNLSLGLNIKVLQVQYANGAAGWGMDLGGRYQVNPEVAVAAVAENLNSPKLDWASGTSDNVPANLRLGVAGYIDRKTTVSFDVDQLLSGKPALHLGAEETLFDKLLSLRAGVTYSVDEGRFMPAAGLGVHIYFLEFAYAYASHFDLDGNHILSLNWGY